MLGMLEILLRWLNNSSEYLSVCLLLFLNPDRRLVMEAVSRLEPQPALAPSVRELASSSRLFERHSEHFSKSPPALDARVLDRSLCRARSAEGMAGCARASAFR